jgi:glycerate kinase
MNVLIATDKFKGSASADLVANSLALGMIRADPKYKITRLSLADGGEGTLDILKKDKQFKQNKVFTQNQLGEAIVSCYLTKDKIAYIEMSSACGLHLTPNQKTSPMTTSTYGVGLMIKDALGKGFKDIVLFAGGTSTNDGGIGIASAFGIIFKDRKGNILKPQGSSLGQITFIDTSKSIFPSEGKITLYTDVTNKLHGQEGAAHVYAKQKGASEVEIEELDLGLKNIASIIHTKYGMELQTINGTGAAGGVAACLLPFCNGKIESGSDVIIDFLDLETQIKDCDILITGEGKVDQQTLHGKIVSKVTSISKKYNKRTILVAGQCELFSSEIEALGVTDCYIVLEQAKNDVISAMTDTVFHLVGIGEKIGELLMEG